MLLIGFAAIAEQLGLEAILGAFIAGAIVSIADRDEWLTHPDFRRKLEAIGFGFFIPVFFVTTGVKFDLDALLVDASNLAMVPIFLAALVIVRGLPALIYRRRAGIRSALPPHGAGAAGAGRGCRRGRSRAGLGAHRGDVGGHRPADPAGTWAALTCRLVG